MGRNDRRDYGRDPREEFDREGYSDNNFDRSYDSAGYNIRGGRGYDDRPYDRDNYPPQSDRDRREPSYRNARPPQSRRDYDNDNYRPMEDTKLQEREYEVNQPKPQEVVPQSGGASNILVSYPKSYQEVKQLIDSLRSKQAIIIDIVKLEPEDAQRVLDFLSGANYALGGSMQRLNTTMFVFTPGGVSIKIPYDIGKKR